MTFRDVCVSLGLTVTLLVAAAGPASAKNAANTHEVIAKVVAVDLQAKSIQAYVGTDRSQTFPVAGEAAKHLDQIAIGRMFKLTFQDGDGSAPQVVIAIKPAKNVPQT